MTHERFYEKVYGIYGEQKFKDDVYNLKDDIKFFCAYINRNKRSPFKFYLSVEPTLLSNRFGMIYRFLGGYDIGDGYSADMSLIEESYGFYLILEYFKKILYTHIVDNADDESSYICKEFYEFLVGLFKWHHIQCRQNVAKTNEEFIKEYFYMNALDSEKMYDYIDRIINYWESKINE